MGNGDGNGRMAFLGGVRAENYSFFHHLQRANLISQKPLIANYHYGITPELQLIAMYRTALRDPKFVLTIFDIWKGYNAGTDQWCTGTRCPELFPLDLFSIDEKIDNGLPLTGDIQASGTSFESHPAPAPTQGAAGTAVCVNNTVDPPVYNSSFKGPLDNRNTGKCAPIIIIRR